MSEADTEIEKWYVNPGSSRELTMGNENEIRRHEPDSSLRSLKTCLRKLLTISP